WARYMKEDYRACIGGTYSSFCYDRDGFGADHLWGAGLVAWFEAMGDSGALAEAENLGAVVERLWAPDSPYSCYPAGGCLWYGIRATGRHLILITRLAEVTANPRWIALRDKILDILMSSVMWDPAVGMYVEGDFATDPIMGPGAFAAGGRIQSAFQIG